MATAFPTSKDDFVNPQSTDSVQIVSHAAQHANANDAIEALETKVGVNNSTDPNSIDYKVKQLELNFLDAEEVQDLAAGLLNHTDHSNLTVTYNDIADKLILSVSNAPSANYTSVLKHTVKAAENLTIGQPVYVTSANGTNMLVSLASNAAESTSSKTLGLIAQNLSSNNNGFVITEGLLSGLNTSSATVGDPVWLGSTGTLIYGLTNKPKAPQHLVFIGIVTRAHANQGEIFVKVQNGFELEELHNVSITAPATGEVLIYNATTGLWTNTNTMASKSYVDTAVSGLGNTAATTYVPLSILGNEDGVATLDPNGFIPQSQLDIDERVQDVAAKLITDGTHYNITVSYNDTNSTLSLSANYDDEEVMDAIAASLTAGNGITKTYNDPANTITLAVDTTVIADKTYVNNAISNLINSAPAVLDTLKEIADALGNDANFATTITTALATKLNITTAASTYLALADTDERIQDVAGGMVSGNIEPTGLSVTYDDPTGKLNFDITTADLPGFAEATQDVVGGMVTGNTESTGLAVTYDDPTGKLNFEITTSELPGFTEAAQDAAASLFDHAGHSNVTATYDDTTNKINLSVIAQLTQEQAQDYIAPLFTHGLNPNITATYDDVANKLILETIIPPSKAIMSNSAPTSPADGTFWLDTDEFRTGTTKALKVWQASSSTWEYVASDLSLSTTNTWTSKNTYTNGIIIGLDGAPASPVHGQIYYNKPLNKLKVWDGLLWQDIQGSGGGGGGLTLIPTDASAPPSTFFVGLIAPPTGATALGDLWIDVDDDAGATEFIYAGPEAPENYNTDTLWIDTDEPITELIYSANEPATPSYAGELWIDLDDTAGQAIVSSLTPPTPAETDLWIDLANEEGYLEYKDLFKNGAASVQAFVNLPSATLYPGLNVYVVLEKAIYVSVNDQWKKMYPNSDSEVLSWIGF